MARRAESQKAGENSYESPFTFLLAYQKIFPACFRTRGPKGPKYINESKIENGEKTHPLWG